MKKILGLMLGLSLVLGTVSAFAQDNSTASTDTSKKKMKKHKKAKKDSGAMSSDTSSTK